MIDYSPLILMFLGVMIGVIPGTVFGHWLQGRNERRTIPCPVNLHRFFRRWKLAGKPGVEYDPTTPGWIITIRTRERPKPSEDRARGEMCWSFDQDGSETYFHSDFMAEENLANLETALTQMDERMSG